MQEWAIQCEAESPPIHGLRISLESKEHHPIGHSTSLLWHHSFLFLLLNLITINSSTPHHQKREIPGAQALSSKQLPPMAATVSTVAMLNAKCLATNSSPQPKLNPAKPSLKPTFLNLPAGLLSTSSKPAHTLAGSAIAGAVFSTLSHADPAFAAQQIAELAEGDNRGLALLLPIIPAIAWVLFNILQPALNQINRMRSTKGVIIGLGLSGLVGYGFGPAQDASAAELAAIAEASGSDNRGQLLLFVVAPAILWVLYNILQPALNQINRMRSQ